ncbi:uncharacterized protein OCT59_004318 [Rhizophagus irregularis]|uniref:Uncharacterized protein n=2 Tax=Rhizophagus irregularis TaxID=588596 RepID=U9T228_RHIID|nr:hypothetical protein GLOIN_2v1789072 [Rhizophagus irregularis DAOM 181602=DAOM 197198]EXX73238.1 hypothetical protein RirG_062020 [Rhizophagus irregularis DAOM 197198w]UZO12802.1 hypothetical protein OCT59_004318 [Rhizophagus irregularis]POG59498.1 hypothetical protein GLOIN_2v1789072 [Rhizophagus irregularis DAOM 181602=DAOM 197198]CAG8706866.1 17368_t:CDS:2 [Rhizophagus irregularis]GBC53893.1 hypothetical protein GLOIN_2v1789072 [Rhizophagus irregularis DAOM 181602=DAOM 197198]|eukprot:XP_025166364.1 hypothetical protein GLOIN_2v1789072 [Rhizophagus irregularis DAOM 181602=DAOM 197198]
MQQSSKSIKFEIVFVLILVGIFVYRYFQDQEVDKDETHENQLNDFDENEDLNEYLPPASKYDPHINYDELAWKAYYKMHKGEPFAEKAKKIIESHN